MEIPRLSRLTAILLHLQSKRLITATELAEKYDISIRTVYRDIKALEEAGVPIVTIDGKGYSLLEGYRLPPVMFTEMEANAMITAWSMVSRNKDSSLVDNYKSAITKVKAILRYDDKDKAELLGNRIAYIKNYPQTTSSNYLSTVQIALTHFKLLHIKYHALSKDEVTQRKIEPQAIYHTQDNWIVIAWCQTRDDYREFRLDRIQTIQLLDETFEARNFDLLSYFKGILKKK